MKAIFIITLIPIFTINILVAQNSSVVWGNLFKQPIYTQTSAFLAGTSEARFLRKDILTKYTFWLNRTTPYKITLESENHFILNKFDSNNNLIFSKELNMLDFPERATSLIRVEEILTFKDKFIILVTSYDKKKSTYAFYLHEVNFDGTLTGKNNKVTEIQSNNRINRISLAMSPDSSKILVSILDDNIKIAVMKSDLSTTYFKVLHQQKKECELLFSWLSDVRLSIDNQSRIFFLSRNNLYRSRYSTALYTYHFPTNHLEETILDLGENTMIDDCVFHMDKSDQMAIVGFYTTEKKPLLIEGSFYLHLNAATTKIESVSKAAFPLGETSTFQTINCITPDDGSIILQYEYVDFRSTVPIFENEIRIACYDKNGMLIYHSIVYKAQWFMEYSGYASTYNKDDKKLYIIFNDAKENVATNKKEHLKKMGRDPVPVLVTIDSLGSIHKKQLFDKVDPKIAICPYLTFQNSTNEWNIWGVEKIKNYRLGTLKFNE
ncbi:MAG TPA: hypothetical protein VK766_05000 [Cytophagaceae bacterium]|jgi:hypothetical protein|nr:hypothetical protein [Cytophagaceae bacterium]